MRGTTPARKALMIVSRSLGLIDGIFVSSCGYSFDRNGKRWRLGSCLGKQADVDDDRIVAFQDKFVEAIEPDLLFAYVIADPETRLRTPARRAQTLLREMFAEAVEKQYGRQRRNRKPPAQQSEFFGAWCTERCRNRKTTGHGGAVHRVCLQFRCPKPFARADGHGPLRRFARQLSAHRSGATDE